MRGKSYKHIDETWPKSGEVLERIYERQYRLKTEYLNFEKVWLPKLLWGAEISAPILVRKEQ